MEPLRHAARRSWEVLLAEAQQSAGCNSAHTLEARLSRWLSRSRDLSGSDTLPLAQEFLGQMLGSNDRIEAIMPIRIFIVQSEIGANGGPPPRREMYPAAWGQTGVRMITPRSPTKDLLKSGGNRLMNVKAAL